MSLSSVSQATVLIGDSVAATGAEKESSPSAQWLREHEVRPEYKRAASMICLQPSLMARCKSSRAVALLNEAQKEAVAACADWKLPSLHDTLRDCILLAWPHSCHSGLIQTVPGLGSGNVHSLCTTCITSLEAWQRHLMALGLYFLSRTTIESRRRVVMEASSDQMIILLETLMLGGSQCQARRTFAFFTVLAAVEPNTSPSQEQDAMASPGESLDAIIGRVWTTAFDVVDDFKDLAVRSAILEPSKMYCNVRNLSQGDSLDVHGANLWLGFLLSCLAVQLSRQPCWNDECAFLGVVDFISGGLNETQRAALLSPNNLGRCWETVAQIRQDGGPRINQPMGLSPHKAPFDGMTTPQDAAAKVATESWRREHGFQLARILEAFAGVFRADCILEPIFARIFQCDASLAALEAIWKEKVLVLTRETTATDVRSWLYDDQTWKLRMDRAQWILALCGVCKDI